MHRFYNCEDFPKLLKSGSSDGFIVYTHIKVDGFSDCVRKKVTETAAWNSATLCIVGSYSDGARKVDYPRKGDFQFPTHNVEFVGFNGKLLRNSEFRSLASISPSHAFWALLAYDCVFADIITLKLDGVTEEYLDKLRCEYAYGYEEMINRGLRVHKLDGIPEVKYL